MSTEWFTPFFLFYSSSLQGRINCHGQEGSWQLGYLPLVNLPTPNVKRRALTWPWHLAATSFHRPARSVLHPQSAAETAETASSFKPLKADWLRGQSNCWLFCCSQSSCLILTHNFLEPEYFFAFPYLRIIYSLF